MVIWRTMLIDFLGLIWAPVWNSVQRIAKQANILSNTIETGNGLYEKMHQILAGTWSIYNGCKLWELLGSKLVSRRVSSNNNYNSKKHHKTLKTMSMTVVHMGYCSCHYLLSTIFRITWIKFVTIIHKVHVWVGGPLGCDCRCMSLDFAYLHVVTVNHWLSFPSIS